MRVVVVLLVLLTALATAHACPHGAQCLVAPRASIDAFGADEQVAARPRVVVAPAVVAARRAAISDDALAHALRVTPRREPDVAMPWIWQTLRREVYRRMPRYRERRFTAVASPVIVSSTYDSVPGIGVQGDF